MLKIAPLFFKNILEKLAQRCRHYFYEYSLYTAKDYPTAMAGFEKFQGHLLERISGEIIQAFENEAEGHCYSLEEYLSTDNPAEHSWIIEVFDGTNNFLRQIPFFSVGLTYVHQGQAQETAFFDPLHDEFFHACRGKGAQLNARRLEIRFCPQLLLRSGYHPLEVENHASQRQLGAPALSLGYVAAGRMDMIIAREKDRAPVGPGAKLLFKEAKGVCFQYTDPRSGEKYALYGHKELLKNTLDQWNSVLSKPQGKSTDTQETSA